MTLSYVVGFSPDAMKAKERALFFYDKVVGKKVVVTVESQVGANELGEPAWFTTIWFTNSEDVAIEAPPEKFEYIGHTGIDPDDPDWESKWKEKQATIGTEPIDHTEDLEELKRATKEVLEIQASEVVSDGAHGITADTILSVQLDVERAQEGH